MLKVDIVVHDTYISNSLIRLNVYQQAFNQTPLPQPPAALLFYLPTQQLLPCFNYTLSNVIQLDEKLTSFHQYLRYCDKCGTIGLHIPSAIILAKSHFASTICHIVGLFEYVIYS